MADQVYKPRRDRHKLYKFFQMNWKPGKCWNILYSTFPAFLILYKGVIPSPSTVRNQAILTSLCLIPAGSNIATDSVYLLTPEICTLCNSKPCLLFWGDRLHTVSSMSYQGWWFSTKNVHTRKGFQEYFSIMHTSNVTLGYSIFSSCPDHQTHPTTGIDARHHILLSWFFPHPALQE